MSYKNWLGVGMAVMLTALAVGCGKKEKEETTPVPELSETTGAGTSDTGDIFDEFYDDLDSKDAAMKESEETFSTSDFGYTPEFVPDGRYVVQVSCVGPRSIAEAQVNKLENQGYPAYIAEVENPTPDLIGTYYRIRIGGFTGVSKAKEFGEQALMPAGYDFWVDNRANDNVGMGGYGLGESSGGDYGYSSETSGGYETSTTESSSWGETETAAEATPASTSEDTWGEEPAATTAESDTWEETGSTAEATPASTSEDTWSEAPAETATETTSGGTDDGWGEEPAASEQPSEGTAAETAPAAQEGSGGQEEGGEEWDDWGNDW